MMAYDITYNNDNDKSIHIAIMIHVYIYIYIYIYVYRPRENLVGVNMALAEYHQSIRK